MSDVWRHQVAHISPPAPCHLALTAVRIPHRCKISFKRLWPPLDQADAPPLGGRSLALHRWANARWLASHRWADARSRTLHRWADAHSLALHRCADAHWLVLHQCVDARSLALHQWADARCIIAPASISLLRHCAACPSLNAFTTVQLTRPSTLSPPSARPSPSSNPAGTQKKHTPLSRRECASPVTSKFNLLLYYTQFRPDRNPLLSFLCRKGKTSCGA